MNEERYLLAEALWSAITDDQRTLIEKYEKDYSEALRRNDEIVEKLWKTDREKARDILMNTDVESPLRMKYNNEIEATMSFKLFEALLTAYDILHE